MKKLFFKIILIFSGAICINAQSSHKACLSYGCFESGDTQLSMTVDGDELFYADYKEGKLIWESKFPVYYHFPWVKVYTDFLRSGCKNNVQRWKPDMSAKMKPKEAPEMIIYPRDQVVKEEDNTLICFMNHYFPPSLNIKWTKNDVVVKVEDAFIKCLSNPDGTFYVFSHLDFVPNEGDIYSCTVEHEALETPQTKFWEVDINEMSIGPSVFCGLGVSLGLLGVVAGIFFYVKAKQYEDIQNSGT